jgi:hypothetical protein
MFGRTGYETRLGFSLYSSALARRIVLVPYFVCVLWLLYKIIGRRRLMRFESSKVISASSPAGSHLSVLPWDHGDKRNH